ncbi:protein TIC 20-IV, chloroplastic [Trifolium repens]|nr:protein TIC 20-IV, chloroplastic [Trifolium repens]
MIGNGGTLSQGSILCYACQMPAKVAVSSIRSFWGQSLENKPRGMAFTDMSAASSHLLSGGQNLLFRTIPVLPSLRKSCKSPRAMKDGSANYRYPPMTKKPRWWWRTLSCIPYLLPFHQVWMYAQTAYNLHPFLEKFEFYTYPFLMSIGTLPRWSLIAYFVIAYLTIVRRKEWPHFFRYHVALGMLIEIALQVTGIVSRWMPKSFYWGKLGMHFWTTAFFIFLFTTIECIRCALVGMYADIPFVCDAAYIQIPYE